MGHETPDFQRVVDKFIERFVLCGNCVLPEIDMVVKGGVIKGVCKACGWRGDLDNTHKLCAYIIKNPPSTGVGFAGEAKPGSKVRGKKKKGDDEGSDDGSFHSSLKKDKKEKKEKKEKKSKQQDGSDDDAVKEKKEKKKKKKKKKKK